MLDKDGKIVIQNSMIGYHAERVIEELTQRVNNNAAFLNKQDIKVLEYLASKGDYPEKQATLVKI